MSSDDTFLFSHALLREAALSLISTSERKRLHGLAFTLERKPNSPLADLSPHLVASPEATLAANASLILALANEEAARGNFSEALGHYEKLASLIAAPAADRLEGMLQATRLLERFGRHEPALAMVQQAIKLADEQGEAAQRGRSRMRYGAILRRRGQFKQALAQLLEAETLCRDGADLNGQAESVCERGMVHQATGAHDRAEECFVAGERLFRRKGNLEGVCRTLGNLALVHGMRGRHQAALAALDEAAELAEILDNALVRARICGNRANVLSEMGELHPALEANRKALGAFEACGDARGIATTIVNLGGLLEQTGDFDGAEAHYLKAQSLATENGDRLLEARVLGNRGVLHAVRGQAELARAFYSKALAQAKALGDREHEMHLLVNLGRSWQSEGQHGQALHAIEAGLELAQAQKQLNVCAAVLALKAQVLFESGQGSAAQQCALDALDWCDKHQLTNSLPQFEALAVLARHECATGNAVDAGMLAREALDVAGHLAGLSPGDAREVSAALPNLRALAKASDRKEQKRTRR